MNKELRTVILLNYIYIGLTNFSSIIMTPFITRGLGDVQYGLYSLAFSTFCYFLVADFGIGAMVVRNVTKYQLKKEYEKQENFLFSALLMFSVFSVVATVFCMSISYFADVIFKQTFDITLVSDFRLLFNILTVNTFLLFFQNYFFCIISGYQKYIFTKVVFIIKIIVRGVCIPVFMLIGGKAWWIFTLDLAITIVTLILFAGYTLFILKTKIKYHYFDKGLTLKLYYRTALIYSSIILDNVYWNISSILIAATIGSAEVGIFAIALTFCQIFSQLSGTIVGYFLPNVTKLVVEDAPSSALTNQMITVARPIFILLSLVLAGFITVGKDFLNIWVGPSFVPAYYLAVIILSSLLFPQIEVLGETVLQAKNKYTARFFIYLLNAATCFVINYFVIKKFGYTYSWVGLVIPTVVYRTILMNINYQKAGLNIMHFIKAVVPKMLLVGLITGVECYFISRLFAGNVIIFLLKGVLVCVAYAINIWFIYLSKNEKNVVLEKISGFVRRKA